MRRLLPFLLAALLLSGAPALLSANPITWNYATDGSNATLPGNATITGNLTANATTTLKNLTVTGSTNLPAAGISCTSLPTFTGDVVNNTSCVTTIQPGAVTTSKMANVAGNSLLGNATGSAAAPAAVPVNGCAGALTYSSGTGFNCNGPGAFPGDPSGAGATSGHVGQIVSGSTTTFAPTSNTQQNWLTLSVPSGDWICYGSYRVTGTGVLQGNVSIGTTSATNNDPYQVIVQPSGTGQIALEAPTVHLLLASTTSVYLVAAATFTTSTSTYAQAFCERIR